MKQIIGFAGIILLAPICNRCVKTHGLQIRASMYCHLRMFNFDNEPLAMTIHADRHCEPPLAARYEAESGNHIKQFYPY